MALRQQWRIQGTATAMSMIQFTGLSTDQGRRPEDIQRAGVGPVHDDALRAALAEVRGSFHQCSRCGTRVCPENRWNAA